MKDKTYQARVTALSIAQCTAVVKFLRANGQNEHAENVEAAINMVVAIVSNELGRDILAQAMSWAIDETGDHAELSKLVTAPH